MIVTIEGRCCTGNETFTWEVSEREVRDALAQPPGLCGHPAGHPRPVPTAASAAPSLD